MIFPIQNTLTGQCLSKCIMETVLRAFGFGSAIKVTSKI